MDYPGKKMIGRYEQVRLYSPEEYDRRRNCLLERMKEADVQVLYFAESSEEAYDEWLMGVRFLDGMVLHADGGMTGIRHSSGPDGLCGQTEDGDDPEWPLRGRGAELRYRCSGAETAQMIASAAPQRVGIVLPDHLSAELYDALLAALPKAKLVDMSIPAAQARAVKSGEELFVIRQACEIQKKVFDALPQMIRAGREVGEVYSEIYYLMSSLGASGVVHGGLICNGPQDQTVPGFFGLPREHRIEYGDRFFSLFEANGPGHHHAAFGRHLVLGDPLPDWERTVNDAAAIHDYAVSLMKPGAFSLAQIAVKTRKFSNRLGYELRERIGWNWMHSMGGYYYEQYSLEDYTEELPLLPNTVLHCHPLILRPMPDQRSEELFVLNTYFLSEQGAEDLFQVPKGLIVL